MVHADVDGDVRSATPPQVAPARDRAHDALHVRDAPLRMPTAAADSSGHGSWRDLPLTRERGDEDQGALLTVGTPRGRWTR